MPTVRDSTFIIIREDRVLEPKTVVSDGLRIGRLPDSDIWINHPKVSRLHAGVNEVEGYFYLTNLSASSGTTLNGRAIPFNEAEALAIGDELQIGPFFLYIDNIEPDADTLTIRVGVQFGLSVGEREPVHKVEAHERQLTVERVTGALEIPTGSLRDTFRSQRSESGTSHVSEITNAIKIFWEKRTREKAGRPSPLHPRKPPRPGKARFNWIPTRDLIRPWPFAIFIWAGIAIAAFSAIAAFARKATFAPGPISNPHTTNTFALTPPIAVQPNGNSCTSCHAIGVSVANKEKMNANCEACHKTEAFVPTIISKHRDAGITCTTCHTEHNGEHFRPMQQALESCARCHNDENKKLYKGKSVHTPHGGTYGYPVVNGIWEWKGYDAEELAHKPELMTFLKQNRVTADQKREWRNAQFHGIHLHRVRVVPGINGIDEGDGVNRVLSCSSCHKSGYTGDNVDRSHPRTTCQACHNARVFNETPTAQGRTVSCASCHVEHAKDSHWASTLLSIEARHVEGKQ
jgi:hypothetical protein